MRPLDDLITSITEGKEPLADVLRRCLVLAYSLKNEKLKAWVEQELNGYGNDDELPSYRRAHGTAKGLFLGPYGAELRDQPLPASILKTEHRWWATDISLRQPVAAYDASGDKHTDAHLNWPQDLVAMYQKKFYPHMALNRAWMEIPASVIAGMLDTVRTRVLTFALQIRDELPSGEEEAAGQIAPQTVDRIMNVTILGGTNVFGNVHELNAPTVNAGDNEGLKAAMTALGVGEPELARLEESLRKDGLDPVSADKPEPPGKNTLAWISNAAKQVGKAGLSVGSAVAEEAIKRVVFSYLGL